MATWIDIISLLITISLFGGAIYGIVYVVNAINQGIHSTKESLKSQGLEISATGVAVKTSQRFTHEDQIDATQRHVVRAFGASSFRKGEAPQVEDEVPLMHRQSSSKSDSSSKNGGEEKKKKMRIFGSK